MPRFPSLTFPNHYTLVTGLYPEANGIVANHMYDAATGESFSYTDPSSQTSVWWLGQPIWNLAQQFNVSAGTVFWVGSEAEINGGRPNRWLKYNASMPNRARVDQLFQWLDSGDCRLCMIYFSAVDDAGHAYGAASPEVLDAVAEMDELVGLMRQRLADRQLSDRASLVLLADHGMATVKDYVYLDDYLDLSPARGLTKGESGAFLNIWPPQPTDPALVNEIMTNLSRVDPAHMRCWKKEDMPAHYHYALSSVDRNTHRKENRRLSMELYATTRRLFLTPFPSFSVSGFLSSAHLSRQLPLFRGLRHIRSRSVVAVSISFAVVKRSARL